MTQLEIVKKIQSGLSFNCTQAHINEVINAYQDHLIGEILEGRGCIPGVGSFHIIHRKEHKGYNMHKGKVMTIPAHYAVKFRASRAIKESVNV